MGDWTQRESGGSKLDRFRRAVWHEFGHNLEKATPANVRDFMDRHQEQIFNGSSTDRFVLNEPKTTYEVDTEGLLRTRTGAAERRGAHPALDAGFRNVLLQHRAARGRATAVSLRRHSRWTQSGVSLPK